MPEFTNPSLLCFNGIFFLDAFHRDYLTPPLPRRISSDSPRRGQVDPKQLAELKCATSAPASNARGQAGSDANNLAERDGA